MSPTQRIIDSIAEHLHAIIAAANSAECAELPDLLKRVRDLRAGFNAVEYELFLRILMSTPPNSVCVGQHYSAIVEESISDGVEIAKLALAVRGSVRPEKTLSVRIEAHDRVREIIPTGTENRKLGGPSG